MKENIYLDRRTTDIMKGVGIVLQFVHHLFTFPEWWDGAAYYGLWTKISPWACYTLKICVSVFCFITGYTYFYDEKKDMKGSVRRIGRLLLSYWLCLIPAALIGTLLGGYEYGKGTLLKELFALERPSMVFCWYVIFFICLMICLPLLIRLLPRNNTAAVILAILMPWGFEILEFACRHFLPFSAIHLTEILGFMKQWLPGVLGGYLCARLRIPQLLDSRLCGFRKKHKYLTILVFFCISAAAALMRNYFRSISFPILIFSNGASLNFTLYTDIFFVIVFVLALHQLINTGNKGFISDVLVSLGKKSMYMWFVSCIFFGTSANVFKPLLYLPKLWPIVLVWGLLLCWLVSVPIEEAGNMLAERFHLKTKVILPDKE